MPSSKDLSALVGIIVPCYNQGRFAAECITSLREQTFKHWRAVVVDDASTDGSGKELDGLAGGSVSVVHLATNVGLPTARNIAMRELSDATYLLPVDCDDYLATDYIERLVSEIDGNARIGCVHGTMKPFGRPHPLGVGSWPLVDLVYADRYLRNTVPGPGTMFRASVAVTLGGWRDAFRVSGGADYDLWLRVVEAGWGLGWVKEALYYYRQHPDSMMATKSRRQEIELHRQIFRYHARAIGSSIGVERFASRLLLPAMYEAVHDRRWSEAATIFGTLSRHAFAATLWTVGRHYAGRVRARVGAKG